jgi:hypothetical protein
MTAVLSAPQLLGVVLASMAMGAGLLLVTVDRVARLFGDDSFTSCLGLLLLLVALVAAGLVPSL